MNDISFFCLTLDPDHESLINDLNYITVGLGNNNFSENCFTDKRDINISNKTPFYGEYTFHYWIWKNYLNKIKTSWVGFCQYRKFFVKKEINSTNLDFENFKKLVLKDIKDYNGIDCILGKQFSVENYKPSKIIKNHLSEFLLNPTLIFNKKKRNLKFHFDLFHGKGNLDAAINLLSENDKKDFKQFMLNNTSFNPHNMFVCKREILKNYYEVIFPWLEECERIFGFNDLDTYGLRRIYAFLAERFMSYWFNKNYLVKELPILVKDLNDYKNL